jgi:hypothetical protein
MFPIIPSSRESGVTPQVPDALPIHPSPMDRVLKYRRSSLYNAFRRHLGINTTWYLHPHFVWYRICPSRTSFACALAAHV